MKKLALCLLAVFLLSGCAGQEKEVPTPSAPLPIPSVPSLPPTAPSDEVSTRLIFTDDLGREVSVERPRRVAVTLGSFAQVWQLAGGEVCAAPDDAWEDLQLDLPEGTVNLGRITKLSLEKLLACEPDFILAGANTRQDLEWRDTLEQAGIPTAYFDVPDFEGYLRLLDICTQLTGQPERYEEYGARVAEGIEAVRQEARTQVEEHGAPKVLVLRASPSIIQAKNSEGNVLGELLADLGCVNIADTDAALLETLSLEHILAEDPDFIFFVQRGGDTEGTKAAVEALLSGQPTWELLSAVKNDRVFYMDKALFSLKPNHRWAEAYETAAELLWGGPAA